MQIAATGIAVSRRVCFLGLGQHRTIRRRVGTLYYFQM